VSLSLTYSYIVLISCSSSGLTGVGGFIPLSSLPQRLQESFHTESVTMAWGSRGFFGYSMCTPLSNNNPFIQWWSIYESPMPPKRDQDPSAVRAQLLERHSAWKSPYDSLEGAVYQSLINLGCSPDQPIAPLLILPRYTTPRLPHWTSLDGSGKIILIGDAAHAMPPDSGQGVSCAAEDAIAIGLLLKHYGVTRSLDMRETLQRTAKAYEEIRMRRVWHILDIAERSRDSKKKKTWWQERIRDAFIWAFCK
jgi:2-polyprenyl-6-methoxyphenol hydroxylase-like FAD-dependent oxidoreductase